MKKGLFITLLSVLFIIGLLGISPTASAQSADSTQIDPSGKLTPEQLTEVNNVLDHLKDEANKRLDNGEENFVVSAPLSFQDEPLEMEFGTNESKSDLLISKAAAVKKKTFSHTVKNTAGFNFSHKLYGSFNYKSGKIKTYSYDADLSGPFYSKTHSTKDDKTDPSVVMIRSNGTFKALKYAPVEYKTRIDIELYGSGDYRVLHASIH